MIRRAAHARVLTIAWAVTALAAAIPGSAGRAPQRGLTAAAQVAGAYDAILDADFDRLPAIEAETCGPAPRVACLGLRALAIWWQIQLDPGSRALDPAFSAIADEAIAEAEAWTLREPERAEAWFYLGAALGARGQWKVLRGARLSAARDGKRIKAALERALELDPEMHDAAFGIGAYRYYAAVAPAAFRWLRWLLLLPGGDREGGLEQMRRASRLGQLVRGEADYQLHVVYLWYEARFTDALDLILSLERRYPRNPLFPQIEAEIRSVYFSDAAGSLAASERLLARAERGDVHRAAIARVTARLNIAVQRDRLGDRAGAITALDAIITARPTAPAGALARAEQLRRTIDRR